MSVESSPPSRPPMLSPDRQWVWDGTEWKPVSDPSNPTHKGVFAAYNAATAAVPVVASNVQMGPVRAAALSVPLAVTPRAEADVPLWRRTRSTGLNRYLYIGAAGVGVLIAIVLFNNFVLSNIDFSSIPIPGATTSKQPAPPVAAVPLTARSDAGRADRLIMGILTPSVASMTAALGPVKQDCDGTLTLTCGNVMSAAIQQVKHALSVFGAEAVPGCVAAPVNKVKLDLTYIDVTLGQMKHSYDANQAMDFTQYLARLNNAGRPLQADTAAAAKAPPQCDATVAGP